MKTRALECFRQKLAAVEPVYGLWVTLESASITDMAVALGLDWVVIDAEHGHLDWKDINEHIRAGLRSDTVLLVRLAERSTSLAKRALDIGADGVVIPWVETVEQVEQAIRDCRYPPEGQRGIGGERATVWGQCLAQHTAEANEHVLVVPMIESVAAIANVAEMCQVDGVDVFFFGPADFSATAGYRGQWEGPGVAEQILELKDTINSAGKHCGVMATSLEDLIQRRDQFLQDVSWDIEHRLPNVCPPQVSTRRMGDRSSRMNIAKGNPKRPPFRIALTADFYDKAGQPKFADLGLRLFDGHDRIQVSQFSEHRPEIAPDQISGCQGVIVLTPRVTADSLADCDDLLAVAQVLEVPAVPRELTLLPLPDAEDDGRVR